MDMDAKLVSPGHIHPGRYYTRRFLCIGLAELLFGSICIALEVVNIGIYAKDSSYMHDPISPGIWCGVWFLLAGFLAVISSRRPAEWNIIGGITVALFSAIGSVGLVCYKIIMVILGDVKSPSSAIGIHVTIALISFAQFLISVAHIILNSRAICV